MASSEPTPSTAAHQDTPGDSSKHALEMKTLDTQTGSQEGSKDAAASSGVILTHPDMSQSAAPAGEAAAAQESANASSSAVEPSAEPAPPSQAPAPTAIPSSEPSTSTPAPELLRFDSVAIGPANENVITAPPTNSEAGPVCHISLLISHTGARHAYRVDEKYLTKRKTAIPAETEDGKKDPYSITLMTLKELILREWKEEWGPKPSTFHSIRLISYGKMLDDKSTLREAGFKEGTPNVVHIAVKPQDMVDDEEATKTKSMGRDRGDSERTPGCRCVIM